MHFPNIFGHGTFSCGAFTWAVFWELLWGLVDTEVSPLLSNHHPKLTDKETKAVQPTVLASVFMYWGNGWVSPAPVGTWWTKSYPLSDSPQHPVGSELVRNTAYCLLGLPNVWHPGGPGAFMGKRNHCTHKGVCWHFQAGEPAPTWRQVMCSKPGHHRREGGKMPNDLGHYGHTVDSKGHSERPGWSNVWHWLVCEKYIQKSSSKGIAVGSGKGWLVHRCPVFLPVFWQSPGKTKQKPEIILILQNETWKTAGTTYLMW